MEAQFRACGDTALVVQFGETIDPRLSDAVLALDAALAETEVPGVVETVPTFRSLMIHYDPLHTTAAELRRNIEPLIGQTNLAQRPARTWRIPVCYEHDLAPDLHSVAARIGRTADDVVALHSGATYHVYMIGFLPGYPYAGDLPPALVLPRLENPRVRVPAGSVAIATTLTAIYPVESPGGWHLIGSTPIAFFDAAREPPALIAPGDRIAFEPVGRTRYEEIRQAVADNGYEVPHEEAAP